MSRVMVTGALGNVGREVVSECGKRALQVRVAGLSDVKRRRRFAGPNALCSMARPRSTGPASHADSRETEGNLMPWILRGRAGLVVSFPTGVDRDIAAVRAAIVSIWSNGQIEGQITKLKLVNRQIHGRGKLDLRQAKLIVT